MAAHGRQTRPGEGGGLFDTTHWDDIRAAQGLDEATRARALEVLTTRYWRPVYSFLRCKGHSHHQAQDLTQGFFHEVILGRGLFVRADPCKGRFRTYLLTALTRYAGAERRKDQAKKRMARRADLPPESIDLSTLPDPHSAGSPDRVFGQAWAADLLARAMADVEAECRADGRATHWAVFYERVVKPILEDVEPPALESLCSQFGIEGEKTASNMVITVKRRFRATVRRLLGQTLGPGGDVDEELNDLIAILVDHAGAA